VEAEQAEHEDDAKGEALHIVLWHLKLDSYVRVFGPNGWLDH